MRYYNLTRLRWLNSAGAAHISLFTSIKKQPGLSIGSIRTRYLIVNKWGEPKRILVEAKREILLPE